MQGPLAPGKSRAAVLWLSSQSMLLPGWHVSTVCPLLHRGLGSPVCQSQSTPSTTVMLIPHHLWWGFNIGQAFVSLNPTGPVSFVTHSVYLTRFPQQEPCWSTMLSLSWARWPPTEKWWEKTQVVPQAIAHNPLQLLLLMHLCLFLP